MLAASAEIWACASNFIKPANIEGVKKWKTGINLNSLSEFHTYTGNAFKNIYVCVCMCA